MRHMQLRPGFHWYKPYFNLGPSRISSLHTVYSSSLSHFNLFLCTSIATFITVGYACFNIGSVLAYYPVQAELTIL